MDSICHLICTNSFKSTTLSIPSPFIQNQILDLNIQNDGSSKVNVSLLNGSPYINIDVNLKATVDSAEFNLDLSDNENLLLINKYASSLVKHNILDYLYKTSKDYHSDIAGFGKYLASSFSTIDEFKNIDWPNLYSDSFFNVNLNVDVITGYLLVQS